MAARNLMSETLDHLRRFCVEPEIEWAAPGSIAELKWAEDGHAFSLNSECHSDFVVEMGHAIGRYDHR